MNILVILQDKYVNFKKFEFLRGGCLPLLHVFMSTCVFFIDEIYTSLPVYRNYHFTRTNFGALHSD